jgi:hypothetical protein
MQQIIDILKQTLLNEHLPNEQVQNIINSIDLGQINLQDLPCTTQYLTDFLGNMGLEESLINSISSGFMTQLEGLDLGEVLSGGGILDGLGDMIRNVLGGD